MVKKRTIIYILLFMLLLTASVPYLAYGVSAIRNGYEVVGGLNASSAKVSGKIGALFAYFKDIIAVVLLGTIVWFKRKFDKNVMITIVVFFVYGFVGLICSGRSDFKFLVAGFRTFMYFGVINLIFMTYKELVYDYKWVKRFLYLTQCVILIQTVIVSLQVTMSNSWGRFGSGAYRFSGLFPGSGNLGCYSIAVLLFLSILNQQYKILSNTLYLVDGILLLFLSIASGTRTCIILVGVCFAYNIFTLYGKSLRLGKKVILIFLVIVLVVSGSSIMSKIVCWTGRGALMDSGSGRISFFINMISTATPLEMIIGRGLGVGTNASISMGLQGTQVSDSTINLIFTQFGIGGLLIGFWQFWNLCKKISKEGSNYFDIAMCIILTLCVMLVVGNLFEHIAMCLYLVLTYYLFVNFKEKSGNEKVNNNR